MAARPFFKDVVFLAGTFPLSYLLYLSPGVNVAHTGAAVTVLPQDLALGLMLNINSLFFK